MEDPTPQVTPTSMSSPSSLQVELESPEVSAKEEASSTTSSPSSSSRSEIPPLVGIEGYASSTSATSTPRDEFSSGSPSPVPDDSITGKMSCNGKPRVKLGKDLSMMMQALNSLQSPEEKIAALCKKYADLLDQQKILQKQLRLSQKKQGQTMQEKDRLHTENNKVLLARTKLESLCRELQKRNKAVKDEQKQKSIEEVTLRQEMATEYRTSLDRIQNQMKNAVDGSTMLENENLRMGGKLNEIVEQYKARETALENVLKQHDLQNQLMNAQLKQAVLEHQEYKERNAQEKQKLVQQLLEKNAMYESKLKEEKELRVQLQYYSEKFEDFQSTLEKSNEIFTTFRTEMDKMSKKLKQAEKRRATIQKKYDDSTKALVDTVDYTQQLETKQARLEKLSRALQAERNTLAQRLRHYEDKKNKDLMPKQIMEELPVDQNELPPIPKGNEDEIQLRTKNGNIKNLLISKTDAEAAQELEQNLAEKNQCSGIESEEVCLSNATSKKLSSPTESSGLDASEVVTNSLISLSTDEGKAVSLMQSS